MRTRVCLYGFVCFCVLVAGQRVSAREQEVAQLDRRTMQALRMNEGESITLDGRLDEPVWQRAVPATDFVQQDPVNGGTPTERTEVRIVFDRERLYMGVTCFDSEVDKLLGNTMKRDEFLRGDDRFMWVIDTFLDARNGYFFEMNPSGLMADSLMSATGPTSREWDGIWDARVRRSEIGWTIELEIPFRTLNFNPDVSVWGINFQRSIRRKSEENLLDRPCVQPGLVAPGQCRTGDRYQRCQSRARARRQTVRRRLGRVLTRTRRHSHNWDHRCRGRFGLQPDARPARQLYSQHRLCPNGGRSASGQPDALSPCSFQKSATFFSRAPASWTLGALAASLSSPHRVIPFFSRRIGLDETGRPQKVEFGTKLIGQVGAQDIGMLHVRTAHEGAIVGEDFTVLRVKRRLLTQSYVGALYTGRFARRGDATDLHTAGFDFRLATSTFRGSKNLDLNGFYLHTTNPFDTGENAVFGVSLDYPNDRWDWGLAFREIQENYGPAIGFAPRVGFRRLNPRIQFSPRPSGHAWIRRLAFGGNFDLRTDMRNRFLTRELDFTVFRIEPHSEDTFELHVIPTYERLEEDFVIHPGVVLPAGAEYEFLRYRAQLRTAHRRILAVEFKGRDGRVLLGRSSGSRTHPCHPPSHRGRCVS